MSDAGALSDIRVLDLGHVLAGPFAGTLLADLGADVIKVEHPQRGDTLRRLGPRSDGVPLWWKVAGRNKRSLALDLRLPAGRDVLLELAAKSDALIENFRPGTLERWGLAPDQLWEVNSRLVILRISGFGQDGSGAGRPGFGRVGEALSGAVNLTGESDGQPLHVGFSLGDATSGMMGAFGVLAALHEARRSGRGDVVDVALFESLFRMIEWQLPMAEKLGRNTSRQGNQFPIGYAVGGSYAAADGRWVTVSAATEAAIAALLRLVGGDALATDPRYADFDARSEGDHMEQIDRAIAAWIGARSPDEVLRELTEHDVAAGLVYDPSMMLADPYLRERGAIIEVEDSELGSLRMPGVVPRLKRSGGSVRWAGPRLGEHSDEILGELLGFSEQQIDALRREGVVGGEVRAPR
jgi:crotonobetainyl-CoA:carnitine CoA-transferase CaiB-like acyl-CoA transferase